MRLFLLSGLIVAFAILIVLAVVFRSRQARDMLKWLRNALWIYVAILFAVGIIQIFRRGI